MLTSRSQRLWVLTEAIVWLVAIVCVVVWLMRYVDRVMSAREPVRELAGQGTGHAPVDVDAGSV